MSKYTMQSPFEYRGVRYFQNDLGEVRVLSAYGPSDAGPSTDPNAICALVEAERNEWHWTNADKTEARKRRWVVRRADTQLPALYHDDFEGILYGPGDAHLDVSEWNATIKSKEVYHDFLAWHAAQQQPEEPIGLGAVVEVEGRRWVLIADPSIRWVSEGGSWKRHWNELLASGPVTVLSTGVES